MKNIDEETAPGMDINMIDLCAQKQTGLQPDGLSDAILVK